MQVNPLLPIIVSSALAIFLVGLVLRVFKQPHVIGYILVGVLFSMFGYTPETELLHNLDGHSSAFDA